MSICDPAVDKCGTNGVGIIRFFVISVIFRDAQLFGTCGQMQICPGAISWDMQFVHGPPQRVSRGKVQRDENMANTKHFERVVGQASDTAFSFCPGVPLACEHLLSCKINFVVQMTFVLQMGFSPFVVQNFVVQNSHLYDKDKLSYKI